MNLGAIHEHGGAVKRRPFLCLSPMEVQMSENRSYRLPPMLTGKYDPNKPGHLVRCCVTEGWMKVDLSMPALKEFAQKWTDAALASVKQSVAITYT